LFDIIGLAVGAGAATSNGFGLGNGEISFITSFRREFCLVNAGSSFFSWPWKKETLNKIHLD